MMRESNAEMVKNELIPDRVTGLKESDATLQLQRYGYNELPSTQGRSLLATAWEVAREPMFLMPPACGEAASDQIRLAQHRDLSCQRSHTVCLIGQM